MSTTICLRDSMVDGKTATEHQRAHSDDQTLRQDLQDRQDTIYQAIL